MVIIVSYLSHSVSGICEWPGRVSLVWYPVGQPSSEGWIGVEGPASRVARSYGWPVGTGCCGEASVMWAFPEAA